MYARFFGALLFFSSVMWSASGLTYSTYLREGFTPAAIATDTTGNVYLAGSTTTDSAHSQTAAMVAELDPAGASYLYLRTFGGSSSDAASGIALDAAGNAYVTGTTTSADFPVTPGQQTGTLPAAGGTRAFLVKFDPQGEFLFSEVLGSVDTTGLAVAITADGGILVSGVSSAGLQPSPGAYNIPDTTARPFLMKVDPTGSKLVFTATGIGGSALALDAAGNIYMAGSTPYTDYPTTPGAYQTVLASILICSGVCTITFPGGTNQYVTKVDPVASKLIYSTGVASQYQTVNHGLAVDAAGNAYVTGVAYGGYPWTLAPPNANLQAVPFLTKLDAAGASAPYSIPLGGRGVALGSQGDVFVGGVYDDVPLGLPAGTPLPPLPVGVASLPAPCRTNNSTTFSQGTVSRLDAATGNVLGTVLVEGSSVSTAGIAFAGGSSVWVAGSTSQPDLLISPGALGTESLNRGPVAAAYLGQAGFGPDDPAAPRVSCLVDGANQARAGVIAPNQLLTLLGTGIGPATGIAAADNSTTWLGGVQVTFDGVPAPLLYASSSQINVAVPGGVLSQPGSGVQNFTVMQVSVNGVAVLSRELPLAASNPGLFADLSGAIQSCTVDDVTYFSAFTDFAINADGAINSCAKPAPAGSVISFFLNGLGVPQSGSAGTGAWLASGIPVAVTIGSWSAEVVNVIALNPFVWRVDVLVPAAAASSKPARVSVTMDLNLPAGVMAVGPLTVQSASPFYTAPGNPFPLTVWVGP